jgi:hypothetical protein
MNYEGSLFFLQWIVALFIQPQIYGGGFCVTVIKSEFFMLVEKFNAQLGNKSWNRREVAAMKLT